jgi:hypothetical protein
MAGGKRRKAKIIKDKKEREAWAESVFLARASEEGLPACKPWGDSRSFDCVVGRPGKFVAVQVKCTIAVDFFVTVGCEQKYEEYREAWGLLRKAAAVCEPEGGTVSADSNCPTGEVNTEGAPRFPRNGSERMQAAQDYFRRYMERGLPPRKIDGK